MACKKPTLRIDEDKCRSNIARLTTKAEHHTIRPHFKTHQSIAIGKWFLQAGVEKITVSSVGMAKYFAANGWSDILIAFPVNILEISDINELARDCSITLLVESKETLAILEDRLINPVSIVIEIDSGSGRSGVHPDNIKEQEQLMDAIEASKLMVLEGFYSHAGHTYSAKSREEILEISGKALRAFSGVARYGKRMYWGDTPSCSVRSEFAGIHTLTAGNLVFYDIMQYQIGSCKLSDVAVAVECPVVSVKSSKDLVIYGGAIHFSKDSIEWNNQACFGLVVRKSGAKWSDEIIGQVYKLSQEHGKVTFFNEEEHSIGDTIYVLPVHACLTAQSLGGYQTLSGLDLDHFAQKKHTV